MSHKDGRVVLSAWVEPVLRDYAREAAKAACIEFSRWVEGAVQRAVAEQSAAKALRIYPVHASNLTDVVKLLEDERDEARAEVERLRDEVESHRDAGGYVFRGGYIEDASGGRWWSAGLLTRMERERDEARELQQALHSDLTQWKQVAEEVIGLFDPSFRPGAGTDWPLLRHVCLGAKEANMSLRDVKSRARRACQLLVEETGADGPVDVDTAAERAAALIRELRDQVADLTAAQEESEHQMHMRIRSGYDKTIADSWRAALAKVERERDALRRVYVAANGWLTRLGAGGHRYHDGVPGELMDAVDAVDALWSGKP